MSKILMPGYDFIPHFGMRNNRKAQAKLHKEPWVKTFGDAYNYKNKSYSKKEVQLTPLISKFMPKVKNSKQDIGDCTGHATANIGTTLCGVESHLHGYKFPGEIAVESSYGLIRVETQGRRRGSWNDGGSPVGIARSLKDFGILPRLDFSRQTRVREHDLRKYDGEKSKRWGFYGCGGQHDRGLLDQKIKEIDIQSVIYLDRLEDAAVAIENGFPVVVCSNVGYDMNRTVDGIWEAFGEWLHAMIFCGVRWFNNEIQLMLRNSWGVCAGGPFPGVEDKLSKTCCGWIRAKDAQRMLDQMGSYAVSIIKKGLKRQRLTLDEIYDY
jgi:hypothetical protein